MPRVEEVDATLDVLWGTHFHLCIFQSRVPWTYRLFQRSSEIAFHSWIPTVGRMALILLNDASCVGWVWFVSEISGR
ncbi:hypothetical protein Plhal304r1_c039g0116841 [Plasmopara halstedii]